jgi:hypothetical protein
MESTDSESSQEFLEPLEVLPQEQRALKVKLKPTFLGDDFGSDVLKLVAIRDDKEGMKLGQLR